MKKLYIYIILLACVSAHAQNVALENSSDYTGAARNGNYYKDINGVLTKFLGTWHYQNTTTNPTKIFEITFYKETMADVGSMYTTDGLISKFKYIENGVTLIDTYTSGETYYIGGSTIFADSVSEMDLAYSEPNINNLPAHKIPSGLLHIHQFLNVGAPATLTWSVKFFKDDANILFKMPLVMTFTKTN